MSAEVERGSITDKKAEKSSSKKDKCSDDSLKNEEDPLGGSGDDTSIKDKSTEQNGDENGESIKETKGGKLKEEDRTNDKEDMDNSDTEENDDKPDEMEEQEPEPVVTKKRGRPSVQKNKEIAISPDKDTSKVDIPEGKGTALGNISRVDASISRFKNDDMKLLHAILFKVPGKNVMIKKNIKKFNGFDFTKNSDDYKKRLATMHKFELKQLKIICEMLDLQRQGSKDEICDRIMEFLMEPRDNGKAGVGGRPKRTAAVRANNRGYSSHDNYSSDEKHSRSARDKGKRSNLRDISSSESDEDFQPSDDSEDKPKPKKRGRPERRTGERDVNDHVDSDNTDEEPQEDDADDSDEDKQIKRRKTGSVNAGTVTKGTPGRPPKSGPKTKPPSNTPAKRGPKPSATKRSRTETKNKRSESINHGSSDEENEADDDDVPAKPVVNDKKKDDKKTKMKNNKKEAESSSDDEPLAKAVAAGSPPTDDEIKVHIKKILDGANLEQITMKTVCQQVYAHYPNFDLAHKKDFIKSTVKSLIST